MITPLPASECVAVPWKNGGGVTREVCVFPAGAGMDDFLWRISMAEVTKAGPFSVFEGIDRHLTVLHGRLQLDLGDERHLLSRLESLDFDGEAPAHGTPIDGPVSDLNIMTRRGRVTALVRQVAGPVLTTAPVAVLIDLVTLDAVRFDPAPGHIVAPHPSILIEMSDVK